MKAIILTRNMLVLILAILATVSNSDGATTNTVGASGDYSTIALAEAACIDGDTIEIIDALITENGIDIDKSITIKGQGADVTTVQGHASRTTATDRVFYVKGSATVIFEDMTIKHGNPTAYGGAIRIDGTVAGVTVTRCAIIDNDTGRANDNAYGAGIYYPASAAGVLTVTDSTFAGNVLNTTEKFFGAAIYAIGINNITIRNSTFSENKCVFGSGYGYGGAVHIEPDISGLIQNCTFVSNEISRTLADRSHGGAISGNANTTVESCLFADNIGDLSSDMYSVNYSNCVYEGTLSACTDLGGNSLTADAKVNVALADNGGPTMTHALLKGSPAISAGSNPGSLTYDQRGSGYERVVGSIDCGAYEYGASPVGTLFKFK